MGAKKNNKQKTQKLFSDRHCGTTVPGTNPHPSQGQMGQNGDSTVELDRNGRFVPDGSQFVPGTGHNLSQERVLFVPGTVPVCSWHRPAQTVHSCLLFFFGA